MPDPVPITREHKKLGDELDDTYIEVVNAATYARGYLRPPMKGNIYEIFNGFFYPFDALFQHTRYMKEMKNVDLTLMKNIDAWVNSRDEMTPKVLRQGLVLFSEYQKQVLLNGVIILKRE